MKAIEIFEEKRQKAIETLARLGVVKYVKDMNLYHGRAGDGKDWEVVPNFNNAGNATGNSNINKVSGLYTGSIDTAQKFANARAYKPYQNAEVHKIVSNDEDAIVFDFLFDKKSLSEDEKKEYLDAMEILTKFGLTAAKPLKYEYRQSWDIIIKKFKEYQQKYKTSMLSNNHVEDIIEELKQDKNIQKIFQLNGKELKKFVYGLVGSYNARFLLEQALPRRILSLYTKGEKVIKLKNDDGVESEYTIDHEYISAWCSANHVVGIRQNAWSATIFEDIQVCHLFDTKKIMSEKQRGLMYAKMLDRYGQITASLEHIVEDDTEKLFKKGSAKEVLKYMKQDSECEQLYGMSSYIWEGWNIGQHTQAVIDFFDNYYTEQVPEGLRPFIKVCMLAHDIGKGHARRENKSQKEMNIKYSEAVFNALNISSKYRKLIKFIITDSQTFTTDILMGRGDKKDLLSKLKKSCEEAFIIAFGRIPSRRELSGLSRICIILQECDSGAYTRYAKIEDDRKVVGGANDRFTQSFELNPRNDPRLKSFRDLDL